jgi:hypothetical protein
MDYPDRVTYDEAAPGAAGGSPIVSGNLGLTLT